MPPVNYSDEGRDFGTIKVRASLNTTQEPTLTM